MVNSVYYFYNALLCKVHGYDIIIQGFWARVERKMESMMGTRKVKNSIKGARTMGFSLIELIVVIAIMAVLIGLIAPAFAKNIEENKKKSCRQNREAILAVYERCLFDSSIADIKLDATSLGKVIPQSLGGTWTTTFKPVESEVGEYRNCRMKGNNSGNSYTTAGNYGVDATSHTAWIKCPDCGDTVSVDLVEWHTNSTTSTDDEKVTEPEPTATPNPSNIYEVRFHENGYGTINFVNPQQVTEGDRAANPGNLANTKTRTFACWAESASASPTDSFDFSTPIMSDMDLYAIWIGVKTGEVWPYADDMTWWDANYFSHGSEVDGNKYDLTGDYNNMYITLKAPSGVFTSLSGSQFVYVEASGDQKIWYHEAMSPEYYSALHPNYLVQLTGNNYEIDITGKNAYKESDCVYMPGQIINGDLVTFIDGSNEYVYVYWHESDETHNPFNLDSIRRYDSHPNNMYRVNKP